MAPKLNLDDDQVFKLKKVSYLILNLLDYNICIKFDDNVYHCSNSKLNKKLESQKLP